MNVSVNDLVHGDDPQEVAKLFVTQERPIIVKVFGIVCKAIACFQLKDIHIHGIYVALGGACAVIIG
jgi:hypothetical protein